MSTALESLRLKLCQLGDFVRQEMISGRDASKPEHLSSIAKESAADTIYQIDILGEAAILDWFSREWPKDEPVEVVMEGLDAPACFPSAANPDQTRWKCLLDPIDGTRGLMYDKRSAWSLAGIAPQKGPETLLSEIVVAAMTELPTTKQWRSDQISAVRGAGLQMSATNVLDQTRRPLALQPSGATNFRHSFSWMAKYFPEGKTLTAQVEERLWDELVGLGKDASPTVFDDQYISTGGAFYELMAGHDRLIADLRPLIHACLDLESTLVCHPYDVATALLVEEAGVIYEHPLGGFPDAPLDTTSGIAWVAYANPGLAAQARPVLQKLLKQFLA